MRVWLYAVLLLTNSLQAEESYLFEMPVERRDDATSLSAERVQLTLHVQDSHNARKLIEAGGAFRVLDVADKSIRVEVPTNATMQATPLPQDTLASFVIDFDEAPVGDVLSRIEREFDGKPSVGELNQFVFDFIDDKNYRGTFEFASRVAKDRSGDCTEHGVLLTALARGVGYPARLIVGVVIEERDDGLRGYGHAWSEIHDGVNWIIADSTMPTDWDEKPPLLYLPLIHLQNEGPGYAMDLAQMFQVDPSRISDVTAVEATTPQPLTQQ